MKTVTLTGIMADFLDSIRAYEHESGEAIHSDERESSEFVDMYFNGGGKINIEENKPLFVTEDGEAPLGQMVICVRKSDCAKKYIYTDEKTAFNLYWVYFIDEANADEYIWRNMRVFSYKDIQNYGVHPVNMIRVEQLAKERIDNGK